MQFDRTDLYGRYHSMSRKIDDLSVNNILHVHPTLISVVKFENPCYLFLKN